MWNRNEARASAPPTETWPMVDIDAVDQGKREHYSAQVQAVTLYFGTTPVSKIEQVTGISKNALPRLARRCLLPADDGRILGFRALLPYFRTKNYERRSSIKFKLPEAHGGCVGALRSTLARFPDIEESLIKHVRQDAKHKKVHEFRIRARDLHRIFIKLLEEKQLPRTEWPFNTKLLGRRSIEGYMRDLINRNFDRSVTTRENQEARAHLAVGTGHDAFLTYEEPYAAVEIDAYRVDSHLSVAMLTPNGVETEVALERLWIVAAVDRFSSAILAYTVVYRSEVSADDVVRVIREAAVGQWSPKLLTIPITYPVNGGLPNGVLPQARGAVWTSTLLDGALAHLSTAVHERARKALGFCINWGPVAHFEHRPNVEKTFDKLAKELFKRLPSTTGGGPLKGRAINGAEKAVRHKIRATEVEELLDVTIAQHNVLPGYGNGYMSPMDVLSYFFDQSNEEFLVRRLPLEEADHRRKFALKVVAKVRGGTGTGRRPYVQLDRVRYTNPILASSGHLVSQQLHIEVDEEDYRQVTAFLPNGAELGVLRAHGKWGQTKHSRRTRKAINALAAKRIIVLTEFDDPVQVYMRHISEPARGKKPGTVTARQATQLTHLAKESGTQPRIPSAKPALAPAIHKPIPEASGILDTANSFFTTIKNRR
jgi:putative transposase